MFADLAAELIELDDSEITAEVRALELAMRRLTARQAALINEVERRALHRADGHRSVGGYLKAHLNWSAGQVPCARRRAKAVDTMAGVGDALADGHVGVAQVDELARLAANPRVRDQLGEVTAGLLESAEGLSFHNFRTVARHWEASADADGAFDPARLDARTASVSDTSGEVVVNVRGGTATEGAEVAAIFQRFVDEEFAADVAERERVHGPDAPASDLPRTDAQRRFDAFLTMVRTASRCLDDRLPAPPLPHMVHLVVSQYDAERAMADAGLVSPPSDLDVPSVLERRQETRSGVPISDEEVVRALIHGHVRRIVMNSASVPVDVGRTRRLFTGPLRTAAHLMGHTCSHPGCDVPTDRCEIDHLAEWVRDHGPTATSNADLNCSAHNRFKTHAGLTRQRLGLDRVITFRTDGTAMTPVGQRLPAGDDAEEADAGSNRHDD